MARGETILDRRHSKPLGVDSLVKLWNDDLTAKLLSIVWTANDRLHDDFLRHIPWDEDYDDLERSISQELERIMHSVMDSFLPCSVQHEPFERESRAKPPARPPQYDIAFVWKADPRIMWPLEVKVLKTDADSYLDDYIGTINQRYLLCRYAPFSNGGAMLGYLKAGQVNNVSRNIEVRLGQTLVQHSSFPTREHKMSEHHRIVPKGKEYPHDFRCHHLILLLSG